MHLKRFLSGALCAIMLLALGVPALAAEEYPDATYIDLNGGHVLTDGEAAPADDPNAAVYTAHAIVYYESGHDFTYGEGTEADAHDPAEADENTVVHITKPGTYVLTGSLDPGQIAVDLGEDAKDDPDAVVTLVLDGVSVTCTVAPAVIFYNVYECDRTGDQGSEPDLSAAGARVIIADGSENDIAGSYVARIYKSYTLNEDGTAVADSKKLHKYDGAFYSKMSMTVTGGPVSDGILNITAENEGLDTEMHLLLAGGDIRIRSGNDGINVNEDNVSVVTVAGGSLDIVITGQTGEGDGIDSNGWLVIDAGTVTAQACSTSGDAGLDAEEGIYLNGGMVAATGNMLDPLTPSDQCGVLVTFPRRQTGGTAYALVDADGNEIMTFTPENDFTYLLMTCPVLEEGAEYSLTADGEALSLAAGGSMGFGGFRGMGHGPALPEGMTGGEQPEWPEGMKEGERPERPEDMGERPEGMKERPEMPDGEPPELPERMEELPMPEGEQPGEGMQEPPEGFQNETLGEAAETFTLAAGLNYFTASGN